MPITLKLTELLPGVPKTWKADGSVTSNDGYIARCSVLVLIENKTAKLIPAVPGVAYSFVNDEKVNDFTGNITIPFNGVAKPGRNLLFQKLFVKKQKKLT
jgi:hypothetical protein